IKKEEFEFQEEKLQLHLDDFPHNRGETITSTQVISNVDVDDEEPFYDDDDEVLTQKPLPQRKENMLHVKDSELFKEYIEIAMKRALLETEREILFLVERSVKETPVEIQETKDLNPVLRKDFVLQA
ncbi:unnamed protein product, partial [Rotaria magnacalcarata]